MSEIQVGQINSTDGSTAITTGADGYVSFAKTQMGGRRNLIINGAMQVAQRGTSVSSVNTNGYYTVDRWTTNMNSGGGTWTVTQESSSGPDGFPYSAKVECTTATGALSLNEKARWEYRIEGQDAQHFKWGASAAESITISFWVKSNKTGTYIWEINNSDGTNTNHICKQYTINAADTWEYKTLTVAGNTGVSTKNDNTTGTQMFFHLVAGTDFTSGTLATSWATSVSANRAVGNVNLGDTVGNYWQITGVQLEVGTVATPFEHRSYGEELLACTRYYQKITNAVGIIATTTFAQLTINFGVEMRASPSVEGTTVRITDHLYNDYSSTNPAPTIGNGGTKGVRVTIYNFSGLTAGRQMSLINTGANAAPLYFDAEL